MSLVEDDPVGDAPAVAAKRIVHLAGGQQRGELAHNGSRSQRRLGGGTRQAASGGQVTLVEHWDGISWSTEASPNPNPNGLNELADVAAVPSTATGPADA